MASGQRLPSTDHIAAGVWQLTYGMHLDVWAGDLGGYVTADGKSKVKSGRIFRSASLRPATQADIEWLNTEAGIRTQVCMEGRDKMASGQKATKFAEKRAWTLHEVEMFVTEARTDQKSDEVEFIDMSAITKGTRTRRPSHASGCPQVANCVVLLCVCGWV